MRINVDAEECNAWINKLAEDYEITSAAFCPQVPVQGSSFIGAAALQFYIALLIL